MKTICLNYYGFQTHSMRMTYHWGNAVVNQVGVPPYRDAIAFGVPRDANKFESTRRGATVAWHPEWRPCTVAARHD